MGDNRIIYVRPSVYTSYVEWELWWLHVELDGVRDRMKQWMMRSGSCVT